MGEVCDGGRRRTCVEVTPVTMSPAAASRVRRYEAIVKRLSAVDFDQPNAVRDFAAFCAK